MNTVKLYVAAAVRHLLSSVLVWLIAKGFITEAQGEQIIAAIALTIVTIAWSLINKYLLNRKIDTALELPAGASREQLEGQVR